MSVFILAINLIKWIFHLPMILCEFIVDAVEEYHADKKGFKVVALTACVGIIVMFLAMGISAYRADQRAKALKPTDTEAEPITISETATTVTLESSIVKVVKNSDLKKLLDMK